jgi:hypothetical protein
MTMTKAAESGVRNKRKRSIGEKAEKDTPPIIAAAQNRHAEDESDAEKEESARIVLSAVMRTTIGTSDENDTERESAKNVLPVRKMQGAITDLARVTRRTTTHLPMATKSTDAKPERIRMRPLVANNYQRSTRGNPSRGRRTTLAVRPIGEIRTGRTSDRETGVMAGTKTMNVQTTIRDEKTTSDDGGRQLLRVMTPRAVLFCAKERDNDANVNDDGTMKTTLFRKEVT